MVNNSAGGLGTCSDASCFCVHGITELLLIRGLNHLQCISLNRSKGVSSADAVLYKIE